MKERLSATLQKPRKEKEKNWQSTAKEKRFLFLNPKRETEDSVTLTNNWLKMHGFPMRRKRKGGGS